MSETVDAVMFYEHATDWVFLRLGDGDVDYPALDKAEHALYQREDLDDLIEAAEDQDDGTSRLELGTVTVNEDGRFEELTVTADPEAAHEMDAA